VERDVAAGRTGDVEDLARLVRRAGSIVALTGGRRGA
jgi:hypothetical protein